MVRMSRSTMFCGFRFGLAVFLFLLGIGLFGGLTSIALAQKAEKKGPSFKYTPEQFKEVEAVGKRADEGWRKDSGHYFSITKITLLMLLFWLWTATSTWTNNDAQRWVDLQRETWNWLSVLFFPIAFVIALFIPIFWIGFPLVVLAWWIPVMVYVLHRNQRKLAADKVLTPEHIGFVIRRTLWMNVAPKKLTYEGGAPVQLSGWGDGISNEVKKGRTIVARNQPGFNALRRLVWSAIDRQGGAIRLEQSANSVSIHLFLDGVWHPADDIFRTKQTEALPPEEGLQLIVATKILCGIDPYEPRRTQKGLFLASYGVKKTQEAEVTFTIIPGTSTPGGGHEMTIQLRQQMMGFRTLDQLGMIAERQERTKKALAAERGLLILSAMPGQGLRTLTNVVFNTADRYTRDFATVEDVHLPYTAIENIQLYTYDSSKGESPMVVLPDVFFREPKVLLLRDMVNKETFNLCCKEVANDRLILTTFRGKNAADTMVRMLNTGIDPKRVADALIAVLHQRLVRRLCPACKEEIPANPEILKRLGLSPHAVKTLYRKRVHTPPPPGQKDPYIPCVQCQEIGYVGRIGIYDSVVVNDAVRHVLVTNPTEAAIREVTVKEKNWGYLIDGARLVADGVTSFDELVRVLKAP